MQFNFLTLISLLLLSAVTHGAPSVNPKIPVNLRIEGEEKTIFEGVVHTRGHNITTVSGGTHHCDGTNLNANPKPGATCTSALADAGKQHGFTFDATFQSEFDDFFITSIAGDTQTATQFWGILLNFKFTPVGGCQQEVKVADEVLFAFDAFSKAHFLKLSGPKLAKAGKPVVFKVVDGLSGAPVAGANVDGHTSVADGTVSVTFEKVGVNGVKATKSDSIRSNQINILVM